MSPKKGRIPFKAKVLISDIKTKQGMPTMKNNIYSTLNLSKSLEQFQEKVTKLLELTNIPEFDVQVFKFREEKIRESALVLAGECIALLLNDLSNSQEFLDKAMQQTQGWWHEKTQKHGYKKRQDFYHVAEHLQDFADAAFSTDNERQSWFKKARKTLKKGQALSLIKNMSEFILSATGERCKILIRERNYILKAYRRRLLKYNEVASQKLPLGSGAVESLIRQVVNLRMKGNSKFWLKNNAEIMLHLRCQWIAGSWDNFCDSIFNSFVKPRTA